MKFTCLNNRRRDREITLLAHDPEAFTDQLLRSPWPHEECDVASCSREASAVETTQCTRPDNKCAHNSDP